MSLLLNKPSKSRKNPHFIAGAEAAKQRLFPTLRAEDKEKPTIPTPVTYPKWAKYIAMDSCGQWYAYEDNPYPDDTLWLLETGLTQAIAPPMKADYNWKNSLIRLHDGRLGISIPT